MSEIILENGFEIKSLQDSNKNFIDSNCYMKNISNPFEIIFIKSAWNDTKILSTYTNSNNSNYTKNRKKIEFIEKELQIIKNNKKLTELAREKLIDIVKKHFFSMMCIIFFIATILFLLKFKLLKVSQK